MKFRIAFINQTGRTQEVWCDDLGAAFIIVQSLRRNNIRVGLYKLEGLAYKHRIGEDILNEQT